MNTLTAPRETEGKNGQNRERRSGKRKGEVAESYCKRRERIKFTELHIAVVTFHPRRIYSPLSRPLVCVFRGLHGEREKEIVRGENMTDRETERENTRTRRREEAWDQRGKAKKRNSPAGVRGTRRRGEKRNMENEKRR